MKNTRKLVLTAIFSAIAFLLMLAEFPLAFLMPEFLKLDFSELPALICSFSAGPLWGAAVCLIKNLMHLPMTTTAGIGELANCLLGVCFVLPAGWIYRVRRTKGGALAGSLGGSLVGAVMSLPINLFITYPFYISLMSKEAIMAMYQLFLPVQTLPQALLAFNLPLTLGKFLIDAAITFVIYKRISPILKGKK